jgi:superfamily II DNA or RNA helicase
MSTIDVSLRPYQENAIREIAARIASGKRRIVIVAPCGAGKTICFARLTADAVERQETVLIIAHRRELIQQTYEKLLRAGLHEEQIGVLMASDTRRRPAAPVQVASIDTLRRRPKPPAHLVIRDECHRALARTDQQIAALYPNAIHLGFTATPFRADGRSLGEFYEDLVVVATVRALIAQGYLVQPRVFTVPAGCLPNLAGVHVRAGDYAQDELARVVDQGRLVGNIVEHWKRHALGIRTVAFAVSIEHSKHIVERFCEEGIAAEHLDGSTPAAERDAILARVVAGATGVVSNVGVWAEGTDVPPIKCAILARPTKSTGLYLQQVGRILRPWQGQRAILLDHAGCAREHGLPEEDRDVSLQPKPTREPRGQVAEVRIRICLGCYAVLPAHMRTCPECGASLGASRREVGEADGQLVEIAPHPPAGEQLALQIRADEHRRIGWDDARKRTYFEQLRALARARRRDEEWVRTEFIGRYGGPPPAEWIERAWGTL